MPNYPKLARTAQRLVEGAGRPLTLRIAPTSSADASKPWRGPGNASPAAEFVVTGVILDFKLTADTSEFIRRGDKQCLIAALSTTFDVEQATVLVDNGDVWNIESCETTEPGSVKLLYTLHLKR